VGIVNAETSFGNGSLPLSTTNIINPFSCGIGDVSNFNASANCAANTVAHDEAITNTPDTPLSALENRDNPLGRQYTTTQIGDWMKNVENGFKKFAKFIGKCQ
jgi:hypothetical protein